MRSGSIISVIGAIVLVLLLIGLFGGGMMGLGAMGPGHMWGWNGMRVDPPWGWGLGIMLLFALFWVAVIVLVVLGVAWLTRSSASNEEHAGPAQDQSMRILRERYARGEITQEEFQEMRQELE